MARNLTKLIGPYGDPMIQTICAMKPLTDSERPNFSEICPDEGDKAPINWDLCKSANWLTSPVCEQHGSRELFERLQFEPGGRPPRRIELERRVAEYVLDKFKNKIRSVFLFEFPIDQFFPKTEVDCSFDGCSLVLVPSALAEERGEQASKEGTTIETFRNALNGSENDRAFVYAVTPTELAQTLAAEDLTRTSLLAALRSAASSSGAEVDATVRGLNAFENRVEMRLRNPKVIGFVAEPESDRSTGEQEKDYAGEQEKRYERARFGWIIRPRFAPLGEERSSRVRQMPGSYPLSAVISIPSWWQHLVIEVRTAWVDPNVDSVRAAFGTHRNGQCAPPNCSTHSLQIPGSVNEIKEKLKYEVRKQPYIDFDATPGGQSLEIGFLGQIVLQGGRLWRSTVVRMGHQQADRIIVLPDMNGIVAEFSCVEPPPGERGRAPESPPPPVTGGAAEAVSEAEASRKISPPLNARLTVPVFVWTSEGRTEQPLRVDLRPFVAREVGETRGGEKIRSSPCFSRRSELEALAQNAG